MVFTHIGRSGAGFGDGGGGGVQFDPDAWDFMNQSINDWPSQRQLWFNSLVVGLKADALWDRLYGFWVFAAPNEFFSSLNIKERTTDFNVFNNMNFQAPWPPPVFTALRGYGLTAGDGAIDINHVMEFPNAFTELLTSFSFGIWSLTDNTASAGDMGITELDTGDNLESGYGLIIRDAADTLSYRIHNETYSTVANTNSRGLFIVSRNNDDISVSRNANVLASATIAPQINPYLQPPTFTGINPRNTGIGGLVNAFNTSVAAGREYCVAFIGKSLNSTQQTALYTRLSTYLQYSISATDLGI